MKTKFLQTFLILALVSCASQRTIISATPTNESVATPTAVSEPIETFTPVVTATPITSTEQDLELALTAYLDLNSSCTKTDRLGASDPNIVFSEAKQEMDYKTSFISEVAKSINNKYSAYVAQRYLLDILDTVPGSIMPIYCDDCGKVYLENNQDGKRYEINWSIFPPGVSMIYSIIWIDDNILVVREAQNEDLYIVLGIDVDKKEPVYFSEVSCSNK